MQLLLQNGRYSNQHCGGCYVAWTSDMSQQSPVSCINRFVPHVSTVSLLLTQHSYVLSSSWGVKGGRRVRLTTLPPSVSRLFKENIGRLWTLWASTACYKDSFTFSHISCLTRIMSQQTHISWLRRLVSQFPTVSLLLSQQTHIPCLNRFMSHVSTVSCIKRLMPHVSKDSSVMSQHSCLACLMSHILYLLSHVSVWFLRWKKVKVKLSLA
jgi:hypothetical protein